MERLYYGWGSKEAHAKADHPPRADGARAQRECQEKEKEQENVQEEDQDQDVDRMLY